MNLFPLSKCQVGSLKEKKRSHSKKIAYRSVTFMFDNEQNSSGNIPANVRPGVDRPGGTAKSFGETHSNK